MANDYQTFRSSSTGPARPLSGNYKNQSGTSAVSGGAAAHTGSGSHAGANLPLSKGQVIHGQVTNITAREITLQLDDGRTMSARYENGTDLGIGENARFRVLSSDAQGILLKTFGAGESSAAGQDTAAYKALEAASLPVTGRNVDLVSSLLKNSMPVHKQMIGTILQQSYRNPEISLSNLVTMNRYQLPIDPETTRQFEHYANQEHQLLSQMRQITEELLALADHLLLNGDPGKAGLFGELLSSFDASLLENPSADSTAPPDPSIGASAQPSFLAAGSEPGIASLFPDPSVRADLARLFPEGALSSRNAAAILRGDLPLNDLLLLIEDNFPAEQIQTDALLHAAVEAAFADPNAEEVRMPLPAAPDAQAAEFLALLNETLPPEQTVRDPLHAGASAEGSLPDPAARQAGEGSPSTEALLNRFTEALMSVPPSEKALLLLSHPGLSKVVKDLVRSNWTLTPQEIVKKDSLRSLYDRMDAQLTKMEQTAAHAAASQNLSGDLSGSLSDMKQNLNFMNTLNEFYNYVQLPLRLTGQDAHGDLYVYGRKRTPKDAGDTSVSCLLHLDLSLLGPMDIRIRMEDKQVRTKFYIEDAAAARLIESHLPELDEAVAAHGLRMKSELIRPKTKGADAGSPKFEFVRDFIEAGDPAPGVRRYSFDIRA